MTPEVGAVRTKNESDQEPLYKQTERFLLSVMFVHKIQHLVRTDKSMIIYLFQII